MPPKIRRSLKKPQIICEQCKMEIGEEEDDIQCDECNNTFHAICSKLDKRQYDYLLNNEKEEYVCHICNESDVSLKQDLKEIKAKQNEIKTKLNKLDQLDELQETIQFMSSQFDDIVKNIANNKKKLEALEKENKNLRNEINDLKNSVKILNNYRVKNDCVIHGIEAVDGSKAVDAVVKVMKGVGVEMHANDIEEAFFLNKKEESKKRSVVVKFSNKKSKQTVMATKPKLKTNDNTKDVFVNDFLSKETLSLLNYAKSLKEVGYRRVYPMAGKVFAKKSELSRPILLRDVDEVDSLLLESTQRRPKRRGKAVSESEDENEDLYESPA